MSIELKIKSKHLSEEARIIRFEEQKLLKNVRHRRNKHKEVGHNDEYKTYDDHDFRKYISINNHRKWDVRNENRATFLARAYIAGVPYKNVEQKRNPEHEHMFNTFILPRVFAMVVKYGNRENGDWEWDKSRYVATQQLKDKINEWCKLED